MQQPYIIAPLDHASNINTLVNHAGSPPLCNVTRGRSENIQNWNNNNAVLPHNNSKPQVFNQGISVNAIHNNAQRLQTHLQHDIFAQSLQQRQLSALSDKANSNNINSKSQLTFQNISRQQNVPETANIPETVNVNKYPKDFSWILLEGHQLPLILHDSQKYIAVKMIETTILSNFPNIFPEEIRNRPPIKSAKLLMTHIDLLNSLVKQHNLQYEHFGMEDTMVEVQDFIDFYTAVKKHYPNCAQKIRNLASDKYQPQKSGWIQINNTVVPFVAHNKSEFLPVQVLSNAAKLDIPECLTITLPKLQVELINNMCSVLKRKVNFTIETKFVPVHFVQDTNKNKIQVFNYLPGNDPMKYAKFQSSTKSQLMYSKCEEISCKTKEVLKDRDINDTQTKEDASKDQVIHMSHKETATPTKNKVADVEDHGNVKLVTVLFCKKNMLCLIRNSEKYVLLEAIFRVFFSKILLSDFINATNVLFSGLIPDCTEEEELAYKSMYGIPTMTLKSKKLLHLETLEKVLPELYSMFQVALETKNPLKRKNEETNISNGNMNTNHTKKPCPDDVICID